ncbi:MAG: serine hydrolase domain-containing protein [Aureisphaera sp.]
MKVYLSNFMGHKLPYRLLIAFVCLSFSQDVLGLQKEARDTTTVALQSSNHIKLRIESVFDSIVNTFIEKNPNIGAGVSVVKRNEILLEKGYGFLDPGHRKQKVDPVKTIFYTASVSKLIITTALLKLIDEGKLNLEDDVQTHLQNVLINNKYTTPVKVKHLITHTSGFDSYTLGIDAPIHSKDVPLEEYFGKHPPTCVIEPGTEINYSNQGIALAGYLVEVISGQPFNEYVTENLFNPLGMTRSTFIQPPPDSLKNNMAYQRFPKSKLIYSVGSMVSSTSDMRKFMMSNFKGSGSTILSDGTLHLMHSNHYSGDRRMPGVALGFFETVINNKKILFHTGARDHLSLLAIVPNDEVGIYVSLSGDGQNGRLRYLLVEALMDILYPNTSKNIESHSNNTSLGNNEIIGYYRLNSMPSHRIEKLMAIVSDLPVYRNDQGQLMLGNPGGGNATNLIAHDPLFYRTQNGGFVAFDENEDGGISNMHISTILRDPVTLRKIPWYERGKYHLVATVCSIVILLMFLLVSLFRFMIRKLKIKGVDRTKSSLKSRRVYSLAIITSLLFFIAPVVGLIMALLSPGKHHYNQIPVLNTVCTILLGAFILGLIVVGLVPYVWKEKLWSTSKRIFFSITAMGICWLLIFMLYWNVVGYQY